MYTVLEELLVCSGPLFKLLEIFYGHSERKKEGFSTTLDEFHEMSSSGYLTALWIDFI